MPFDMIGAGDAPGQRSSIGEKGQVFNGGGANNQTSSAKTEQQLQALNRTQSAADLNGIATA